MKSMIKTLFFTCAFSFLCSSCLTRAPTQYELDKRGVTTPSDAAVVSADANLRSLSTGSQIARQTHMPERTPPLMYPTSKSFIHA